MFDHSPREALEAWRRNVREGIVIHRIDVWLRNAWARRPRIIVMTAQERHLTHLAAVSARATCERVAGGPSPPERTEQYEKLSERFERLDPKDWCE